MNLSSENLKIMASISHEIRNPINAIIGISHLLQKEERREVQEELVQTLIQTSENLRELTNNILDFTKLEEGKVLRKPASFDMRKEIPVVLYAQKALAKSKGVELMIDIAEDVPSRVLLDKVRGMQILVNLVSNAVKFTEEGRVTVEIKVLELLGGKATLAFAIKDTGIGIAEEKQQEIFEPFNQGGIETSMKHGGSGLGLSIAKMLLTAVGGELKLKSRPGEGSEFSFVVKLEVPEDTEIENPDEKKYSPREVLGNRKVLLVDDNEINLLVAGKTLETWGIGYSVARNGLEAVTKVQTEDYAVVLMDLYMPVMDGYEATCAIRNLEPEKFLKLPIIALSGSTGYTKFEEIMGGGFTEFLAKPYNPQDLFIKIMEVVSLN